MSFDPTDVRNALRDEKLLLDLLSWVPGWVVMAQSAVDAILNEQEALRIERDAERRAHQQARTALTDSTERLAGLVTLLPDFGEPGSTERTERALALIDAQIQANQVVLGLARPATEDA